MLQAQAGRNCCGARSLKSSIAKDSASGADCYDRLCQSLSGEQKSKDGHVTVIVIPRKAMMAVDTKKSARETIVSVRG
jgi:hypothetical protein